MIGRRQPLNERPEPGQSGLQRKLEIIIFGTGTLPGRRFDMMLIAAILLSVTVVVLDSVPELDDAVGASFWYAELFFTGLFTLQNISPGYGAPTTGPPTCSAFGVSSIYSRLCLPTSLSYSLRQRPSWSFDY